MSRNGTGSPSLYAKAQIDGEYSRQLVCLNIAISAVLGFIPNEVIYLPPGSLNVKPDHLASLFSDINPTPINAATTANNNFTLFIGTATFIPQKAAKTP
ncbi:hypothetical protein [Chitinophaga nivalis]|uniref:Uncharacterized protein n=1 Tax=Chitinophaga nivalis TaxID=2991709 RepID=A0ABT3IR03_9BACT|nr:hypothetical protein [Chitinophaga nivalis]MCW3464120.1 hypothetical protein [Chitinophaga nivalis]MCW3486190.1 hypothetical protein [Chitinophaga nivalis]